MNNFFGLKFIVATVSVTITVSIITLFLYDTAEANNIPSNTVLKAAIIDQLYDDIPNDSFHQEASQYLEAAGYEVDIFTTKDITLDFYKKLPSLNYKFVVVRSHGVADENEQNSVNLFTGERYQEDKYITEQLFGQAKRATPLYEVIYDTTADDSEWVIVNDTYRTLTTPVKTDTSTSNEYFVITPKLIDNALEGKFKGTIFVLGGCNTMTTTSMAESLVRQGASAVVGWDDQVVSLQNDMVILALLEQLFISELEMPEALDLVMEKFPLERFGSHARMKYYA